MSAPSPSLSPERLVDLERYLFYRDYNRHKRFKGEKQEGGRPEGEKLVHLFLDTINITSLKALPNRILHRIFRADAFDRLVGHHGLGFAAVRHAIVVFAFLGAIRRLGAGLFRLRRSGG